MLQDLSKPEIPSAKVAAGNFADFLYYDLV